MMDAIQRAVPVPQAEVIMHGCGKSWSARTTVLGQRAPLPAAGLIALRMYGGCRPLITKFNG